MKKNKKYLYLLLLICGIGAGVGIYYSTPTSLAMFATSKDVSGSITVPENNYCINHGFTQLSQCMLVMENYSTNVSSAKSYISSKGTPVTSKMAPTITYKEVKTDLTNANGVISTNYHFTLGKGYTFNSSTGIFTLTNYVNADLTDDYINYYTCGSTSGTSATCATMYQIKAYKTSVSSAGVTNYIVTSATRHTYNAVDSLDSEIGLYATPDDTGTSFYYRGNVKNNYVSYAGYTWRIIRQNGDGSVRMIYSGTSPSATGSATSIGTSAFNSKYYDPTYVGYMYSEDFALNTDKNASTSYNNFNENTSYYFGSSYTFDESTKKFSVTGTKISGTWKDVYSQAISSYPYTCFSTSASGTCNVLLKMTKYTNPYTAVVTPISYNSKDYASTLKNTTNSTIKTVLDNWYQTNLLNKKDAKGISYANYLSDEVFCNDRKVTSGSGNLVSPTTLYGPYDRVYSKKSPSLVCNQATDKFTVSSTKGNGALTYPISLLTIDEAALAGGLYNAVNTQYYLYTGQTYWTLSPSYFYSTYAHALVWLVFSTGSLVAAWVSDGYGVRPVINLSADVLITGGDGTALNPYVVTK